MLTLGIVPLAPDISCRLHDCRGYRTMKWFWKVLVESLVVVIVVVIVGGIALYLIMNYVVK